MTDWLLDLRGTLLANRGLDTEEKVDQFLYPKYDRDIHDPFLLKDMDKAVARILLAIDKKETVCIFGDYDADGVPATALLSDVFKKLGLNFITYIPHRHNEHFGLNGEAVKEISKQATLLITVDCGITDVEEVELANKLGLDVIITDHHLPQEKLPPAVAIVDHKQDGCEYPEKILCGTGIAFKLAQALLKKMPIGDEKVTLDFEKRLLDLVGIATIADRVPLIGENRALAKFGLVMLRRSRRPGLVELFRQLKLKQDHLTEEDIAFSIAPALNAAGRMSHADEALALLSTDSAEEASALAANLVNLNKSRKADGGAMMAEIERRVEMLAVLPEVICVGDHSWSPGVISGVASKVLERYQRPVCLWVANDAGEIRGSCRSEGSISMVELLEAAGGAEWFTDYGGHTNAAGFGLPAGRENELAEKLNQAWHKITKLEKVEVALHEAAILPDDISWHLFEVVNELAPFGEANAKPIFHIVKAPIAAVKTFGSDGAHFELQLQNDRGQIIPAISFFNGPKFSQLNLGPHSRPNLLVTIEKSTFKWKPELRLRIVDILI